MVKANKLGKKQFCKFVKNQELKFVIQQSIKTSYIYIFIYFSTLQKRLWHQLEFQFLGLYKICSSGFKQFLLFFLADPIKLN